MVLMHDENFHSFFGFQHFQVQILSPFEIKVSNPEYFSGITDTHQKTDTTDTGSY